MNNKMKTNNNNNNNKLQRYDSGRTYFNTEGDFVRYKDVKFFIKQLAKTAAEIYAANAVNPLTMPEVYELTRSSFEKTILKIAKNI